MYTLIRLLLQEQSDIGLHCLSKRLLKYFNRRQKQTTFVVIGALRVNMKKKYHKTHKTVKLEDKQVR